MKTLIKILAWFNTVAYSLALLYAMFTAYTQPTDPVTILFGLIILVQSILTIIYLSDITWEIE